MCYCEVSAIYIYFYVTVKELIPPTMLIHGGTITWDWKLCMFCFVFNGTSMDKLSLISLFMSYRINNTFLFYRVMLLSNNLLFHTSRSVIHTFPSLVHFRFGFRSVSGLTKKLLPVDRFTSTYTRPHGIQGKSCNLFISATRASTGSLNVDTFTADHACPYLRCNVEMRKGRDAIKSQLSKLFWCKPVSTEFAYLCCRVRY